jgi:hypothetical protein
VGRGEGRLLENGDGGPSPVATPVFDGATVEDVDSALLQWMEQNPIRR